MASTNQGRWCIPPVSARSGKLCWRVLQENPLFALQSYAAGYLGKRMRAVKRDENVSQYRILLLSEAPQSYWEVFVSDELAPSQQAMDLLNGMLDEWSLLPSSEVKPALAEFVNAWLERNPVPQLDTGHQALAAPIHASASDEELARKLHQQQLGLSDEEFALALQAEEDFRRRGETATRGGETGHAAMTDEELARALQADENLGRGGRVGGGGGGRRLGGAERTSRLIRPDGEIDPNGLRELQRQLRRVESAVEAMAWIQVTLKDDRIDHWIVELSYDPQSDLGSDLQQLSEATGERPVVSLSVKFPPQYPSYPPAVRVVSPRLEYGTGTVSFSGYFCSEHTSTAWRSDTDISGLLVEIHQSLLANKARVDLRTVRPYERQNSTEDGTSFYRLSSEFIPTVNSFRQRFYAFGHAFARRQLPDYHEVADGRGRNAVVLPREAMLRILQCSDLKLPLLVEVKPASGRRAYCAVADYNSPDGNVIVPDWMMVDLFLTEGQRVEIRCVELPLCSYCKLQPQSQEFYKVQDPKSVLTVGLMQYAALTEGTSIPIEHEGQTYLMEVVELKPEPAVSLLSNFAMFEVPLEFVPAPDYEDEREKAERLRRQEERLQARKRQEEEAAARRAQEEKDRRIAAVNGYKERVRPLVAAEPAPGTPGTVELAFRFPNGQRGLRRFLPTTPIRQVVWWLMLLEAPWRPDPTTGVHGFVLSLQLPPRLLQEADTVGSIPNRSVINVVEKVGDDADECEVSPVRP
eukprot:TRINITY_DN12215_c0_g1_i1.p1 TRINITY_DN12215_c0_g1~~TRINITY_DN12215_c0_g1_i1.p1  ORF type:complete len:750 (+),score=145.51 TRINITY_DN12215_c0_g1_i1:25-2274(+)